MRELIQLDIIKQILTEYPDNVPVNFFLKDFYKKNRQFGSRDRKFYSDIIYKYFRCKTLFFKLPFEEKLYYSGFLTSSTPLDFHRYLLRLQNAALPLTEEWNRTLPEKMALLTAAGKISLENYFPASNKIDEAIAREEFLLSHFTQPKIYIRIRKKHLEESLHILNQENINFEQSGETFAFTSQTDIAKFLPDHFYEVQDISSQETILLFDLKGDETLWDACSGAGGKSLMILEKYPAIKLYCSDMRPSIIQNLMARFLRINLKPQGVNVYDILKNHGQLSFNDVKVNEASFDIVLADVPCSGSGTWGRTPERLYQFKEEEIEVYSNLQKSIVKNIQSYLKPGGYLIYITCSVYAAENNLNVRSFANYGLELIHENYYKGYDRGADTLYGAVLKKSH